MSTISQQILRRVLDAAADDDIVAAEKALEEYARLRSIAFLDWADRTPNSSLPKWDDNNELYDIFIELQKD